MIVAFDVPELSQEKKEELILRKCHDKFGNTETEVYLMKKSRPGELHRSKDVEGKTIDCCNRQENSAYTVDGHWTLKDG